MDDTTDAGDPVFELARELLPLEGGTVLDVGPAEAVDVAAAAGWPAVVEPECLR